MDITNLLMINNKNNFGKVLENANQISEFSFVNLIDQDYSEIDGLTTNYQISDELKTLLPVSFISNSEETINENLYSDQKETEYHIIPNTEDDEKIADQNIIYPDYMMLYFDKYIKNNDQIDELSKSYYQSINNDENTNINIPSLIGNNQTNKIVTKIDNIINQAIYRQELPIESSRNYDISVNYPDIDPIKSVITETEEDNSKITTIHLNDLEKSPEYFYQQIQQANLNIEKYIDHESINNIVDNTQNHIDYDKSTDQELNNFNNVINEQKIDLYDMIENKNVEIISNPIDGDRNEIETNFKNQNSKINDLYNETERFDVCDSVDNRFENSSCEKFVIDENISDNKKELITDDYNDKEEYKEYTSKFSDNEILLNDKIIKESKIKIDNKISIGNIIKQPVIDQIKINLIKSIDDNKSEIKILLNPENLGKLEIKIDANENKLHLSILSDNKETLSIIKQDIKQLEYDLYKIGINIEEYNLNLNSNNSESQNQNNHNNRELYEYENSDYRQNINSEEIIDNYLLKLESHYVANDSLDIKI